MATTTTLNTGLENTLNNISVKTKEIEREEIAADVARYLAKYKEGAKIQYIERGVSAYWDSELNVYLSTNERKLKSGAAK